MDGLVKDVRGHIFYRGGIHLSTHTGFLHAGAESKGQILAVHEVLYVMDALMRVCQRFCGFSFNFARCRTETLFANCYRNSSNYHPRFRSWPPRVRTCRKCICGQKRRSARVCQLFASFAATRYLLAGTGFSNVRQRSLTCRPEPARR